MGSFAGRPIAVVASDPQQRSWLRQVLDGAGYATVECGDSEQALEIMAAERPGLVVADLAPPRLEGWALCRLLRSQQDPSLCAVPVLIVSAQYTGEDAARITADLGGDGLLPASVAPEDFLAEVAALLERAQDAGAGRRMHFEQMPDGFAVHEEIRRLVYLNEVLSQVNQAIVRANSREELFEAICRVFRQYGHFRLTWIGVLEADGIRLAASDAEEAGCPFRIEAAACGIARNAAGGGAPVVCNHLAPGQPAASCHPRAMEWGVRSCAAFPLRSQGEVYGCLCVHAGEEGFFQQPVVKLLEGVAMEISFALDKIEADRIRREVEERFATAFEYFPAAASISTVKDGTFLQVNRQFEATFGFSREELIGKSSAGLGMMSAEDRKELLALFERQGRLSAVDCRMRAKDGRTADCLLTVEKIRVGGEERILSMMLDIGDRKRIEMRLRESEEKYRSLFDASSDAILLTAPDGRIFAANPEACRIFGRTEGEIRQVGREGLVDPEDPRLHELLSERGRNGRARGELTLLRRDGTRFAGEVSSAVFAGGNGGAMTSMTVRDITEQKAAADALRESEERLRAITESARDAILMMDAEGKVSFWNPAAERIFGYTAQEAIGRNLHRMLLPAGYQDVPGAAFAEFQRTGMCDAMEKTLELRARRKNGEELPVELSISSIRREDRWHSVGIVRDISERKEAEVALRESEERFAAFMSNLPAAAFVKDEAGRTLFANRYFQELLSLHEWQGKFTQELIAGGTGRRMEDDDRKAIEGGLLKVQETVTDSQGGLRTFETIKFPIHVEGKPALLGGIAVDITEREQNEADREAMLSVLRLANSASDSDELIRTVTAEVRSWTGCEAVGVRVQAGDDFPYCETHGFPPEFVRSESSLCSRDANGNVLRDAAGNPLLECTCGNVLCGRFDPKQPYFTAGGSFWTNSISRLLASATESERHSLTRKRCYAAGYESVALIPMRYRGRTLGLLQFNDPRPGRFTPQKIAVMERAAASLAMALEQRATQAALRASEERYRLISENTADVIWLLDWPNRRLTYVSPSVQHLRGYTPEEVMSQPAREAATAESYERAFARLQQRIAALEAGDESARTESDILDQLRRDGSIVPTEVVTTLLRDPHGRLTQVLGVSRDISERVQSEARLLQAQKMESVGRLAGGVAHDFNNLLTVINGYSDMVLESLPPQDPLRKEVAEIRAAGSRAEELTRQLLAFSRKQVIEPRPLNVNDLISDSRGMLGRLVGEDIEIAMDLDPSPGRVMADHGQLHQVLMNLVVNARDAMPAGGRLTLRTSRVELDREAAALLSDAVPGAYVVLEVSDTGEGMSEEVQLKVFEPFFTTKRQGSGTGLGLSTAYGIVRQAGGWIQVDSRPGMGATFQVGLPLAEPTGQEALPEQAAPARIEGFETILVVEDQDEVRRLALAVLKRYHYRTLEAGSGEEALRVARSYPGPIHLLLTDVVMPHMNGKQLADQLRPLRPGIKVLYMSGYSAEVISRQGLVEAGLNHIEKPFSPEGLALKVRMVLGEPRSMGKVLVVDDEESIRGLFAKILTGAGYSVELACDGEQAEKTLAAGTFDLMLTDLVMPNREGIETIRLLRKSHPALKIVAVSGAFGGSFLRTAALLGADATLVKPVRPEQLLETVRQTLGD